MSNSEEHHHIFKQQPTLYLMQFTIDAYNFLIYAMLCGVQVGGAKNQVYESIGLKSDGSTVLLGGLFPIHATSDDCICAQLQDFAIQQVEAMLFAINLVNNDPTLLPGINLTFTVRDVLAQTQVTPWTKLFCLSKARICRGERRIAVSGVIGAHFSRVSMDIANLLNLYKVRYTSTADLLSDKSRF